MESTWSEFGEAFKTRITKEIASFKRDHKKSLTISNFVLLKCLCELCIFSLSLHVYDCCFDWLLKKKTNLAFNKRCTPGTYSFHFRLFSAFRHENATKAAHVY